MRSSAAGVACAWKRNVELKKRKVQTTKQRRMAESVGQTSWLLVEAWVQVASSLDVMAGLVLAIEFLRKAAGPERSHADTYPVR